MWIDPNVDRKGSIIKDNILSGHNKDDHSPAFSLFELNITGFCNRYCKFCPRSDKKTYPNRKEFISDELYSKIINELGAMGYNSIIAYSGFSEPLFHKKIEDMIQSARQSCPEARIELYTNGDALNEKKLAALFASGLSSVHISLYDGPEQIEKFLEMRNKAGIKVDQFILRKRYPTKKGGYGLIFSNRAGMVNPEFFGTGRLPYPLKSECFYPFYMMFVDYVGDVVLCSHDWGKKLIVGNLNHESILEVWSGERINTARERLSRRDRCFRPCSECNVKGTLMGKEHFLRWKKHRKTVFRSKSYKKS